MRRDWKALIAIGAVIALAGISNIQIGTRGAGTFLPDNGRLLLVIGAAFVAAGWYRKPDSL